MSLSVPNEFSPDTTILSSEVNANFAALVANALDKRGDTITGNVTCSAGVTIDGVDISAVIGAGGTLLAVDGSAVTNLTLPAGSIKQVVGASFNTPASSSSATPADTGITLSITPSSTSNKILVLISVAGCQKDGNVSMRLTLQRNGVDIIDFGENVGDTGTTARNNVGTVTCNYRDSPASVSAQTYKVQFSSTTGAASVTVQSGNADSTMLLLEVVG